MYIGAATKIFFFQTNAYSWGYKDQELKNFSLMFFNNNTFVLRKYEVFQLPTLVTWACFCLTKKPFEIHKTLGNLGMETYSIDPILPSSLLICMLLKIEKQHDFVGLEECNFNFFRLYKQNVFTILFVSCQKNFYVPNLHLSFWFLCESALFFVLTQE